MNARLCWNVLVNKPKRQQEGKLHLPCAKGAQGINDHKIDFLPFRAGLSWRCEIEDFSRQAQT